MERLTRQLLQVVEQLLARLGQRLRFAPFLPHEESLRPLASLALSHCPIEGRYPKKTVRKRSAFEAARHEGLALAALQLLLGRLLVAGRHAALLRFLRRGRLGAAVALEAAAHEFLALVAFLVAGLGVAILHALLLLLLRGARLLLRVFLVLREGTRCGEGEA